MPILWISCHDYVLINQNMFLDIQVYVLSLKLHGQSIILGTTKHIFSFCKMEKRNKPQFSSHNLVIVVFLSFKLQNPKGNQTDKFGRS